MSKKIQKTYLEKGLGFPVMLQNVPMIKTRGEWVLDINYNVYMKAVLRTLCEKNSPLTGAEVRFIRQFFEMTLMQFASRFNVTHVGVIKWERAAQKPTKMNWSTEKDLRLFIWKSLSSGNNKDAIAMEELYDQLEVPLDKGSDMLRIDVKKLAA